MKAKRSFSGDAASPRQPRSPHVEAAKWLASRARAYGEGRALFREVEEAFEECRRLAVKTDAAAIPDRCPECAGRGWLVMNEGPAPEHLGDVQRCDCDVFADDEAAIHSARRIGYIVEESGEIVAGPEFGSEILEASRP